MSSLALRLLSAATGQPASTLGDVASLEQGYRESLTAELPSVHNVSDADPLSDPLSGGGGGQDDDKEEEGRKSTPDSATDSGSAWSKVNERAR